MASPLAAGPASLLRATATARAEYYSHLLLGVSQKPLLVQGTQPLLYPGVREDCYVPSVLSGVWSSTAAGGAGAVIVVLANPTDVAQSVTVVGLRRVLMAESSTVVTFAAGARIVSQILAGDAVRVPAFGVAVLLPL